MQSQSPASELLEVRRARPLLGTLVEIRAASVRGAGEEAACMRAIDAAFARSSECIV